jgi:hypothetical protein
MLRSATTRVLINGFEGETFRHGHGLRQGDPLSPLHFVLVMDVLAAMFKAAERAGVLPELPAGLKHGVSLYADDIIIFARPEAAELAVIKGIMACFKAAFGLVVNNAKSVAAPIRCSMDITEAIATAFDCHIRELPCTYLGLPLPTKKLRKADLQLVLDKLARKLAYWKARLLTKDGRVAYVQAVMTAFVIYQLLALDVDPWFIDAVDRLRRGFLWAGKLGARGGCCLVAWHKVCQPKHLGGLGFHDLRKLNAALRARWLWFQKTDLAKPWSGLSLRVVPDAITVFNASIKITIGDGAHVVFWEDPWVDGKPVDVIAPDLVKLVKPCIRRSRTVQQGIQGAEWVRDIAGELLLNVVVQFLKLWNAIRSMNLRAEVDTFTWKWTASVGFSSKTAYRAFFFGRTAMPGAAEIWHAFAPFKVKFHAWLALQNRCWTVDRLARRGLPTRA